MSDRVSSWVSLSLSLSLSTKFDLCVVASGLPLLNFATEVNEGWTVERDASILVLNSRASARFTCQRTLNVTTLDVINNWICLYSFLRDKIDYHCCTVPPCGSFMPTLMGFLVSLLSSLFSFSTLFQWSKSLAHHLRQSILGYLSLHF